MTVRAACNVLQGRPSSRFAEGHLTEDALVAVQGCRAQIPTLPRARGAFLRVRGVMGRYRPEIDESHRQLVLLALAELQHQRPGWAYAIGEAAECYPGGRAMLADFLALRRAP